MQENLESFVSIDLGALSLALNDLLKLKEGDRLVCDKKIEDLHGAIRLNGCIWAYTKISFDEDGTLILSINSLATHGYINSNFK